MRLRSVVGLVGLGVWFDYSLIIWACLSGKKQMYCLIPSLRVNMTPSKPLVINSSVILLISAAYLILSPPVGCCPVLAMNSVMPDTVSGLFSFILAVMTCLPQRCALSLSDMKYAPRPKKPGSVRVPIFFGSNLSNLTSLPWYAIMLLLFSSKYWVKLFII